MNFDIERESDKLLIMLIVTDLIFILFHILHVFHTPTGLFYNPNFSPQQDRGYAEVFQYIKEYWCAILLFIMAVRTANLLYFSWSLLFGYFLIDDSFGVHEVLGKQLGSTLSSFQIPGLNLQDIGELFVSAFFGILFLIAISVTYHLNDEESKEFTRYLFAMLILLVIFGVFTGIIEGWTTNPTWRFILSMIEEGGEMLVMSFMVWWILRFNPE